jgi:hypothetical protein
VTDHWASFMMSPKEIYEQLTGGKGTGALDQEQAQTRHERDYEDERAIMIQLLANTIKAGWQGEASEGAYGAATPLAERAYENTTKLNHAQDLLSRQSESFTTARNSVRPVSDPPQMSVDEPFPFDVDHDKAVQDYQNDAQNNIAVYRAYDSASHYNETNLPQEYHSTSASSGDVSVKAGDTIKVGEPGPGTGEPRQGGPGDTGPYSGGPYPGGGPGSGGPPVGPGSGPGGSQTSPTDFRPGSVVYPVPPGSGPGLTYPSPGEASPVSGGPVGGYFGGGGEFGPRGSGGPDGGPGTGGGRGPGAGAPRSGEPGAGAPRPGEPGAGGAGRALGSGALAAEEAAARRAAQAAAGARVGGVGAMGAPVGAGRGKDDEDGEHTRKVLIEGDGEELFGSDVLTAPEVIGDDEYED